jgi:beta-N-acetylhexosaminidase
VTTAACILGCSGLRLTPEERAFFRDARPFGVILFGRNIDDPAQVRRLTEELRDAVGRQDLVVAIDQEGGRVQRLRPPHWRAYPPSRAYADLPLGQRREIARLGARLIAYDLAALGVDMDLAPVLDVPEPGAHAVIGDRAFGETPDEVAVLGRAAAEGLLAGGVLPVIKHIPGHGRARSDSHAEAPVVNARLDELAREDFAPFKALSDMPAALTAHVIYAAVDDHPASVSKAVIQEVIRGAIGFQGLLLTDDIAMQALSGPVRERAARARQAGCDVVLHCTGELPDSAACVEGAGELTDAAAERGAAALRRRVSAPEPLDRTEALARFDAAFHGRSAA